MKSITILMAEDHKLLKVGLRSLFNETEHITVIAETDTAKDTIDKAKIMKPDVILMDSGLPDFSSSDAIRKILTINPDQKILILSSVIDE